MNIDQVQSWELILPSVFVLSLARLAGFFVMSPFFTRQAVPGLVLVSLMISLSVIVAPNVFEAALTTGFSGSLIALGLKEFIIGVIIGTAAWFPVRAIELTGVIVDTQRGATMAEDFNPAGGGQTTLTAKFLSQAFLAYFFASGGFLFVITVLYGSYSVWPIQSFLPENSFIRITDSYFRLVGNYLTEAILLAVPMVGMMLLVDIVIVYLAKKAQELNPLVFGMPVKTTVMLIVLIYYIEAAFPVIMDSLEVSFHSIRAMGNHE